MADKNLWTNADGLQVRFENEQGRRRERLGSVSTDGNVKEYRQTFKLAGPARTLYTADLNNDGTLDGFSDLDGFVRAGDIILEARAVVKVAGVGGTSVAVSVYGQTGTILTANGLITATQGANANLTLGANIVGSGGTVGVRLGAKGFISLVTVGTYTAGEIDVYYRVQSAQ